MSAERFHYQLHFAMDDNVRVTTKLDKSARNGFIVCCTLHLVTMYAYHLLLKDQFGKVLLSAVLSN
jgi:hypothetical protein